jgi:hypothetical protein
LGLCSNANVNTANWSEVLTTSADDGTTKSVTVAPPVNTRVTGVSVSGCLYSGIYLGRGDSTGVESCTVRTVGSYGIYASTIKSSVAVDCGITAIYGDPVSDSRGEATGSGSGRSAITALNCYGLCSSGYGMVAFTALNCCGHSTSSTGLYASQIAIGCQGESSSATGLIAHLANSCTGNSISVTHKYNMP